MARSFCATVSLETLAQHLADLRTAVASPSGGLVFVSGGISQRLAEVANIVRTAWPGIAACVVPGAGVLSERCEIEGENAASGVLWAGGRVRTFTLSDIDDDPKQLVEPFLTLIAERAATAILFAKPDSFAPSMLDALAVAAPKACIFGAGTVGGSPISISATGDISDQTIAAGLVITGFAPPLVDASPACRLLSTFQPIDEVDRGVVLRIGGRSALEFLSASTSELARKPGSLPLVFAAIADDGTDAEPPFIVRPIRGLDPTKSGVMVGDSAVQGARLAFAVRDASAARTRLEAMARRVSRNTLGAAPRFALYLSCAGRGKGLYGAPDVETRLLRQRFVDLPIAGMHSAFEITPWTQGHVKLAYYTGVLALFRSPS